MIGRNTHLRRAWRGRRAQTASVRENHAWRAGAIGEWRFSVENGCNLSSYISTDMEKVMVRTWEGAEQQGKEPLVLVDLGGEALSTELQNADTPKPGSRGFIECKSRTACSSPSNESIKSSLKPANGTAVDRQSSGLLISSLWPCLLAPQGLATDTCRTIGFKGQ